MTAEVVRLGRPVVYTVLFEAIGSPVDLHGGRYWSGWSLDYGMLVTGFGVHAAIDLLKESICLAAEVGRPMVDPNRSLAWPLFCQGWEASTHDGTVVAGKLHAHIYPSNEVTFGMTHLRGMTTDAL